MQTGKRKTVVWSPHAGVAAAGVPIPLTSTKTGKIKPPTYAQSVGWSDVFAVAAPDSLRLFQITKGPSIGSSHPSERQSTNAGSGSASAAYAQAAAAQAQLDRMSAPLGSSFVPAGTSVASVDLKCMSLFMCFRCRCVMPLCDGGNLICV